MWTVYLVILVLSVVRAAKLQYCQELLLKGSALRKDVATMVFTMDSTCLACYHEIQKLMRLKTQMARLGHNADIMVALNQPSQDHKHQPPSDVAVDLEDAWSKLGRLNGHIFVFDKCGKLAYQVITPWSRQVYPFTAMASLSALYDAPCGECNATSQAKDVLQKVSENFAAGLQGNKLPLTLTIRDRLGNVHNGNRATFGTVDLRTTDPNGQGKSEAEVKESTNITIIQNGTRTEGNYAKNPREHRGSSDTHRTAKIDVSQDSKNSTFHDRQNSTSQDSPRGTSQRSNSVPYTSETSTEPPASREYSELLKRYQPLMKWRTCANLVMSIQV